MAFGLFPGRIDPYKDYERRKKMLGWNEPKLVGKTSNSAPLRFRKVAGALPGYGALWTLCHAGHDDPDLSELPPLSLPKRPCL